MSEPSRSEKKKAYLVGCALDVLRSGRGMGDFSMEAVARAAGVTRLTVYNHFGSRRGLLEALMVEMSREGRLESLEELPTHDDAWRALDLLVERFMLFWASDSALAHLTDAAESDPDLADALQDQYRLGRRIIRSILERIMAGTPQHDRQEAEDIIRTLVLFPTYRALAPSRSPQQVAALIKPLCRSAITTRLADGTAAV